MSRETDIYRQRKLRAIEGRYTTGKPTEVVDAERVIADFERQHEADKSRVERLKQPLPGEDLCPDCYDDRGEKRRLVPQPSEGETDVFACRCGYREERDA